MEDGKKNEKEEIEKKESWWRVLLGYTEGSNRRMGASIVLSIISVISGLVPYYCIYRGADLYIRNMEQAPIGEIGKWCLWALVFYIIKILCFSASTWISHIAAYHILEGLRLRLTDSDFYSMRNTTTLPVFINSGD